MIRFLTWQSFLKLVFQFSKKVLTIFVQHASTKDFYHGKIILNDLWKEPETL